MTFGIIAAMAIEMELIKESMEIKHVKKYAGFEFFEGTVDDASIVLTTCNIGKVNAACCTQILIDNFKIDFIVNTGIAGGINKHLKLLDVIIATEVVYYDFELLSHISELHKVKTRFTCSEALISLAQKSYANIGREQYSLYTGRIATGDTFISCKTKKAQIDKDYSPFCVEMEGAAIGHVASMNQVPFVVIRAISDLADDHAEMVYEELELKAAKNSAQLVLEMIKTSKN